MNWIIDFQHWFYTAFFALLAWTFFRNPAQYAAICAYFRGIKMEEGAHDRVMAASIRRKQMEDISPRLGYYLAALNLVLAFACAVTWLQPSLWYAISCVGMALITGVAYLQLRTSLRRRVAVLAAGRPERTLPSYWISAAAFSALTPLVDLPNPALRFTAIAVCVASVTIAAVAWRLSLMPALLSGVDIPAEQFVDGRLRWMRSTRAMAVAMGVPFVYLSQTSVPHATPLHMVVQELTFVLGFAIVWVMFRKSKRGPSPDDLSGWTAQGVV